MVLRVFFEVAERVCPTNDHFLGPVTCTHLHLEWGTSYTHACSLRVGCVKNMLVIGPLVEVHAFGTTDSINSSSRDSTSWEETGKIVQQ